MTKKNNEKESFEARKRRDEGKEIAGYRKETILRHKREILVDTGKKRMNGRRKENIIT